MLEARDLMVFYENALALSSLDLVVNKGEMRGVIGSNSAGKSTLLAVLSGLILERAKRERRRDGERISVFGRIWYEGLEITSLSPKERVRLGLVLCRERHPVFPESGVEENLRIAAHDAPRAARRRRRDLVAGLFPQLFTLSRRSAGLLSGGEQQMLMIGMALMTGPRLLMLDEPLLGLSPRWRKEVVEALMRLKREQDITILLAEQFARPVLPHMDHAYVLENGMLTMSGTGPELLDDPAMKAAYFGA